jgi:hypothetical protein
MTVDTKDKAAYCNCLAVTQKRRRKSLSIKNKRLLRDQLRWRNWIVKKLEK